MEIQSKRTGDIEHVTKEQWETLKSMGRSRNFNVLDHSDKTVETKEVKITPIKFPEGKIEKPTELKAEPKAKKPVKKVTKKPQDGRKENTKLDSD